MEAKLIVKGIVYNQRLGKILLVKRSKDDPSGPNTWENPGGKLEPGETPQEGALREIMEETGITDISIDRIAYLTLMDGERPALLIVYLCRTAVSEVTISDEHQAYLWADESKCRELLPDSIIRDLEENHVLELIAGA